jgi:DNA uptake protein ComE-like DNA-binding protein
VGVGDRRRLHGRDRRPAGGDERAVAAALAARERRAEARRIVERDPALARELRIGRPDLPREYDDGGLVDLNSAPAALIARICDIPRDLADRIVAARAAGAPFVRVDDAFTFTDIPVELWDRIRDRAVTLPQ